MTCKDCIHFESCKAQSDELCLEIMEEEGAQLCRYFANKAKYINVPCKIGTECFYVNTIGWQVLKCKINEFCYAKDGAFAILDDEYKGIVRKRIRGVPLSDFGKTVFFDEKKAKQELIKLKTG